MKRGVRMGVRDGFYYTAGLGFLALAKAKHTLNGYSSPKPFDLSDSERCIAYDIGVVEHWLSHLGSYTGDVSIRNKTVLELGPGSDLGAGLYLLAKGCGQYNACDVHNLVASVPNTFYEAFFEKLKRMDPEIAFSPLREDLARARAGDRSRLNYVVRDDFDLASEFGESTVDLVFSQAAFEHFDDIEATVERLTAVCRPGATLVAEIDLKTHSRWICDKDPNNIYRYPNWLYNAFAFRGIPNRVRPLQYKAALERSGWTGVTMTPLRELAHPARGGEGMHKIFRDDHCQMNWLEVMLCATRGPAP